MTDSQEWHGSKIIIIIAMLLSSHLGSCDKFSDRTPLDHHPVRRLAPTQVVTNVSFVDTDARAGWLSGVVSWDPPSNTHGIQKYAVVIFNREEELAAIPKANSVNGTRDYGPWYLHDWSDFQDPYVYGTQVEMISGVGEPIPRRGAVSVQPVGHRYAWGLPNIPDRYIGVACVSASNLHGPFSILPIFDESLDVPARLGAADNVNFVDFNAALGFLTGTIAWSVPKYADFTLATHYNVFLKSEGGQHNKSAEVFLGVVPVGEAHQLVLKDYWRGKLDYIHIFSSNAYGFSQTSASLLFYDLSSTIPQDGVSALSFSDADLSPDRIEGTVTWSIEDEAPISKYLIFVHEDYPDNPFDSLTLVPVGTNFLRLDLRPIHQAKFYVQVYTKNHNGVDVEPAGIRLLDNVGMQLPSSVVSRINFTDENMTADVIAGTVTWYLEDVDEITGVSVWLSSEVLCDISPHAVEVGLVPTGTNYLVVPDTETERGVDALDYLLIFTRSSWGVSPACKAVGLRDRQFQYTPQAQVSNVSFADTDARLGFVSGVLSFKQPADLGHVDEYIVYFADEPVDNITNAELAGVCPVDTTLLHTMLLNCTLKDQAIEARDWILIYTSNEVGRQHSPVIAHLYDFTDLPPNISFDMLQFTDADPDEGFLGGLVSWLEPADTATYQECVVMFARDSSGTGSVLAGVVEPGASQLLITPGFTRGSADHILIYAANSRGDGPIMAELILDNTTVRPSDSVSRIIFNDADMQADLVAGLISWQPPEDLATFTDYSVFFARDLNNFDMHIRSGITRGTNSILVPVLDIRGSNFIVVCTVNENGETAASAPLIDNTLGPPTVSVKSVEFADADGGTSQISGIVSWVEPNRAATISAYVIFLSDDAFGSGRVPLQESRRGTNQVLIPADTPLMGKRYIAVYTKNRNGEQINAALDVFLALVDLTTTTTTATTSTATTTTSTTTTSTITTSTATTSTATTATSTTTTSTITTTSATSTTSTTRTMTTLTTTVSTTAISSSTTTITTTMAWRATATSTTTASTTTTTTTPVLTTAISITTMNTVATTLVSKSSTVTITIAIAPPITTTTVSAAKSSIPTTMTATTAMSTTAPPMNSTVTTTTNTTDRTTSTFRTTTSASIGSEVASTGSLAATIHPTTTTITATTLVTTITVTTTTASDTDDCMTSECAMFGGGWAQACVERFCASCPECKITTTTAASCLISECGTFVGGWSGACSQWFCRGCGPCIAQPATTTTVTTSADNSSSPSAPGVLRVSFFDIDLNFLMLGGVIEWDAVGDTFLISNFTLFFAGTSEEEHIANVPSEITTFVLPRGTDVNNFTRIWVFPRSADGAFFKGTFTQIVDRALPVSHVTQPSFFDEDLEVGMLGGIVTWTPPPDSGLQTSTAVTRYSLYISEDTAGVHRMWLTSDSLFGTNQALVPESTRVESEFRYILIYARNDDGECPTGTALLLQDRFVPKVHVRNLTLVYGEHGLLVTWHAPAEVSALTHYVMYLARSSDGAGRSRVQDDIPLNDTSAQIALQDAFGSAGFTHVLVYTANGDGEQLTPSAAAITGRLGGVPPAVAYDLRFEDDDPALGSVGGILSWDVTSASQAPLATFQVYLTEMIRTSRQLRDDEFQDGMPVWQSRSLVAEVSHEVSFVSIGANTQQRWTHFLVSVSNSYGENSSFASSFRILDRSDEPPTTCASAVTNHDQDLSQGWLSGIVSWNTPPYKADVEAWAVYLSEDSSIADALLLGTTGYASTSIVLKERVLMADRPYLLVHAVGASGLIGGQGAVALAKDVAVVHNLSFIDQDPRGGWLQGVVQWELDWQSQQKCCAVHFASRDGLSAHEVQTDISVGTNFLEIPAGTRTDSWELLVIYVRTETVTTPISIELVDLDIAATVSFFDVDLERGRVAGSITISCATDYLESVESTLAFHWGRTETERLCDIHSGVCIPSLAMTPAGSSFQNGSIVAYRTSASLDVPEGATHILVYAGSYLVSLSALGSVYLIDRYLPQHMPLGIRFVDLDPRMYTIGGIVTLLRAQNEDDLTEYSLYYGSGGSSLSNASHEIARHPKPVHSHLTEFAIYGFLMNTYVPPGATHLIAFSANVHGSMTRGVEVELLVSHTHASEPDSIQFYDLDEEAGLISGTILIPRPHDDAVEVAYSFYIGRPGCHIVHMLGTVTLNGASIGGISSGEPCSRPFWNATYVGCSLPDAWPVPQNAQAIGAFSHDMGGMSDVCIESGLHDRARPVVVPQSISFSDTDAAFEKIGGQVAVAPALHGTDVTGYAIYFARLGLKVEPVLLLVNSRGMHLDAIGQIPQGTPLPPGASHLMAFARNSDGEGLQGVEIALQDQVAGVNVQSSIIMGLHHGQLEISEIEAQSRQIQEAIATVLDCPIFDVRIVSVEETQDSNMQVVFAVHARGGTEATRNYNMLLELEAGDGPAAAELERLLRALFAQIEGQADTLPMSISITHPTVEDHEISYNTAVHDGALPEIAPIQVSAASSSLFAAFLGLILFCIVMPSGPFRVVKRVWRENRLPEIWQNVQDKNPYRVQPEPNPVNDVTTPDDIFTLVIQPGNDRKGQSPLPPMPISPQVHPSRKSASPISYAEEGLSKAISTVEAHIRELTQQAPSADLGTNSEYDASWNAQLNEDLSRLQADSVPVAKVLSRIPGHFKDEHGHLSHLRKSDLTVLASELKATLQDITSLREAMVAVQDFIKRKEQHELFGDPSTTLEFHKAWNARLNDSLGRLQEGSALVVSVVSKIPDRCKDEYGNLSYWKKADLQVLRNNFKYALEAETSAQRHEAEGSADLHAIVETESCDSQPILGTVLGVDDVDLWVVDDSESPLPDCHAAILVHSTPADSGKGRFHERELVLEDDDWRAMPDEAVADMQAAGDILSFSAQADPMIERGSFWMQDRDVLLDSKDDDFVEVFNADVNVDGSPLHGGMQDALRRAQAS